MSTTKVAQYGSCPISDTYHDVLPAIGRTVKAFRAKYGHWYNGNLADMMSDAKISFMQSYHTHDHKKGDFQKRVTFVIWHRLLDNARKIAKTKGCVIINASGISTEDDDGDIFNVIPAKDKFCVSRFIRHLSADARLIVRLIFKLNRLRHKINWWKFDDNPKAIRRGLVVLLRKRGWDGDRIADAFEEIGDTI